MKLSDLIGSNTNEYTMNISHKTDVTENWLAYEDKQATILTTIDTTNLSASTFQLKYDDVVVKTEADIVGNEVTHTAQTSKIELLVTISGNEDITTTLDYNVTASEIFRVVRVEEEVKATLPKPRLLDINLDLTRNDFSDTTFTIDNDHYFLENSKRAVETDILFSIKKESNEIKRLVYDSVSFSVAAQTTTPESISFNLDGSKMYISDESNIFQYTLSTPFDLSTASYDSVSYNYSAVSVSTRSTFFNKTGDKFFTLSASSDSIYQYSLSTPFDLTTITYDSVSYNFSSEDTGSQDAIFNENGTKLFMIGTTNDSIFEYSLTIAYDLTTMSYIKTKNISDLVLNPICFKFNKTGTKLLIVAATGEIFEYILKIGFDISTMEYTGIKYSVNSVSPNTNSLEFNELGDKMYFVSGTNDSVYQYSTELKFGGNVYINFK